MRPFIKSILCARHGESVDNIGGGNHGRPESPLTERGRQQAEALADRFESISVEAILSSPDVRAAQTAEIIGKRFGKTIESNDLFREYRAPSELWGKPYDDPESTRIKEETGRHTGEPGWHHSDEDNYHDRKERAGQAIAFLAARPETKLLVISHASFLRTMVARMLYGVDMKAEESSAFTGFLDFENTGICDLRLSEKGDWFIAHWNDIAHFG